MSENLLIIDFGASRIKYLLKDSDTISFFNQGNLAAINLLIQKYNNYSKGIKIICLGANINRYSFDYHYEVYDELESIAHLPLYYGNTNSLIVNIGTGTSFVHYYNNEIKHLMGSGIGGGTLIGLASRLLDTENIDIINELSKNGDISDINTTISDIGYSNISWLDGTMTVSNFNKATNIQSHIAAGIISLVIEPIISITKSLMINQDYQTVFFTGSTLYFNLVRELIAKYSKMLNINSKIIDKYEYGTLLGALVLYNKRKNMDEN